MNIQDKITAISGTDVSSDLSELSKGLKKVCEIADNSIPEAIRIPSPSPLKIINIVPYQMLPYQHKTLTVKLEIC
ncbi:MAG: hypothetical protein ACRDDA_04290 [Aeromonas sp.]